MICGSSATRSVAPLNRLRRRVCPRRAIRAGEAAVGFIGNDFAGLDQGSMSSPENPGQYALTFDSGQTSLVSSPRQGSLFRGSHLKGVLPQSQNIGSEPCILQFSYFIHSSVQKL